MQGEMLASMGMTVHNLFFYSLMMERARDAISRGSYADFVKELLDLDI